MCNAFIFGSGSPILEHRVSKVFAIESSRSPRHWTSKVSESSRGSIGPSVAEGSCNAARSLKGNPELSILSARSLSKVRKSGDRPKNVVKSWMFLSQCGQRTFSCSQAMWRLSDPPCSSVHLTFTHPSVFFSCGLGTNKLIFAATAVARNGRCSLSVENATPIIPAQAAQDRLGRLGVVV